MADVITKSIAEQRSELAGKYDDLEAEQRRINLDIAPKQRRLNVLQRNLAEITEEIEKLESEIGELESRSSDITDQQYDIDNELDALKEAGN